MKYSVTSVMLPHLDLVETCALLRELGYDGLELRVRYYTGPPDAEFGGWGRHKTDVSPDNVVDRADEIKQVLADHGLDLIAFASAVGADELEHIRKLVDGALATGAPFIRISCPGYNAEIG